MRTQAAILVELGQPLEIGELEIPALKPGQVLVEVQSAGVCHTQLLEARGHRGRDPFLPHCLGHEGRGTVVDVGPGVGKVKAGDAVLLSWMKGSGTNVPGSVYRWNGREVNAGGITTFQQHAVISENRLTPIDASFPTDQAALMGCAVPTGLGAVLNSGEARAGQSVAVFGVGGVGLCAVAGARVAGCTPIIAVDVLEAKLDLARRFGATHCIDAGAQVPVAAINEIAAGGVDLAVEASGRPAVMEQALGAARAQGGKAVVLGNAHHGERLCVDPGQFNQGKQLRGSWGGDNQPDRDFPRYMRLVESGLLDVTPLVAQTYALEDVNRALDDLEQGRAARPIVLPNG